MTMHWQVAHRALSNEALFTPNDEDQQIYRTRSAVCDEDEISKG